MVEAETCITLKVSLQASHLVCGKESRIEILGGLIEPHKPPLAMGLQQQGSTIPSLHTKGLVWQSTLSVSLWLARMAES